MREAIHSERECCRSRLKPGVCQSKVILVDFKRSVSARGSFSEISELVNDVQWSLCGVDGTSAVCLFSLVRGTRADAEQTGSRMSTAVCLWEVCYLAWESGMLAHGSRTVKDSSITVPFLSVNFSFVTVDKRKGITFYVTLSYLKLHYVTLRYITLGYPTLIYATLRYIT